MQGFGIKFLTNRLKDNLLIKCSLALTTVCYFLLVSQTLHIESSSTWCAYATVVTSSFIGDQFYGNWLNCR